MKEEEEEEEEGPDEEEPGGGAIWAPLLGRHVAVVQHSSIKTSLVLCVSCNARTANVISTSLCGTFETWNL